MKLGKVQKGTGEIWDRDMFLFYNKYCLFSNSYISINWDLNVGEEPNGQQEGFGRFSTTQQQQSQAPIPAARLAKWILIFLTLIFSSLWFHIPYDTCS